MATEVRRGSRGTFGVGLDGDGTQVATLVAEVLEVTDSGQLRIRIQTWGTAFHQRQNLNPWTERHEGKPIMVYPALEHRGPGHFVPEGEPPFRMIGDNTGREVSGIAWATDNGKPDAAAPVAEAAPAPAGRLHAVPSPAEAPAWVRDLEIRLAEIQASQDLHFEAFAKKLARLSTLEAVAERLVPIAREVLASPDFPKDAPIRGLMELLAAVEPSGSTLPRTAPIPADLTAPQQAPIPNLYPAIPELVISDLRAKTEAGFAKYKTRLQPFNGRSGLVDAYQETLDLAVYLRQVIEEHRAAQAIPAPAAVAPAPLEEAPEAEALSERSAKHLAEPAKVVEPERCGEWYAGTIPCRLGKGHAPPCDFPRPEPEPQGMAADVVGTELRNAREARADLKASVADAQAERPPALPATRTIVEVEHAPAPFKLPE